MAEERAKEIEAAAELILAEMLGNIALTTTIAAHREIKRSRVPCGVCGKRCRSADPLPSYNLPTTKHLASSRAPSPMPASQETLIGGPSSQALTANLSSSSLQVPNGNSAAGSTTPTPPVRSGGYTVGPEKGTGGSTGIGSGSGRPDAQGNVFFDCLVCGRATASNRYAPHLSSCLGFSGSSRRGASRNAAANARRGNTGTPGLGNGSERGSSPYVSRGRTPSEAGESDDGGPPKKGKKNLINTNGKRTLSPKKAAPLQSKKARLNAASANASGGTASGTATPANTKPAAPSKLGRPPTTAVSHSANTSTGTGPGSVYSEGSTFGRGGSETPSTGSGVPLSKSKHKGGGGGGGGTTGRKTLPGMGLGAGGGMSKTKSYSTVGDDSDDDDWYITASGEGNK